MRTLIQEFLGRLRRHSKSTLFERRDSRRRSHRSLGAEALEVRVLLSSVSGMVFHDTVTDGVLQRTERAVHGLPVQLWSAGSDGVIGGTDDVLLRNAVTDAAGQYQFDGVASGPHFVRFVETGPFTWTHQGRGLDPAIDSDVSPLTGNSGILTIDSVTSHTDVNAGIVQVLAVEDRANAVRESFRLSESPLHWSTARWLTGELNVHGTPWYFVTPEGDFFAWKRQSGTPTGTYITTLTPDYFTDEFQLSDAVPLTIDQSLSAGDSAAELNRVLDLRPGGSSWYESYGRLGLRWLQGRPHDLGNNWYFIRPDGRFYAWSGDAGAATGRELAALTPGYFADPILLTSATPQVGSPTSEITMAHLRDALHLSVAATVPGFPGASTVVWLSGEMNQYGRTTYFLNSAGDVFAWNGVSSLTGRRIATVAAAWFSNPADIPRASGVHGQPSPEALLHETDQEQQLIFTGNDFLNWGGQGEKWLRGRRHAEGTDWYYLTPSGDFYAWNGGRNPLAGRLIAAFSEREFMEPWRLSNATPAMNFSVPEAQNLAPVFDAASNRSALPGVSVAFRVSATDGNAGQVLTYIPGDQFPSGAELNPVTGELTWIPSDEDAGSDVVAEFQVRDPLGAENVQTVVFHVGVRVPLITDVSPSHRDVGVGVERHVVVEFDQTIDADSFPVEAIRIFANDFELPGVVRVSATKTFVTFIPEEPLPSSTEITVRVNGDLIENSSGLLVDADRDGTAGGELVTTFRTMSTERLPGTRVFGFVRDSYTLDPLVGVTVRVDGFPDANGVTDGNGRFELIDVPAPVFFVHIDGGTATHRNVGGTQVPIANGIGYPIVGKPFHSLAGQSVQLNHGGHVFDVHLPPMSMADVQPLSATVDTPVTFGPAGLAQLATLLPDVSAGVLSRMQVRFAPNAALDDAGVPATAAVVIPVPPDRLPAPLPANMQTRLVVSIQAGNASAFDIPAAVTFPNVDGMLPGDTAQIVSFDHALGEWVIVGTGTVSPDGLTISSDPGVGVRAPGWHAALRAVAVTGRIRLPLPGSALFHSVGSQSLPVQWNGLNPTFPADDAAYLAFTNLDTGTEFRTVASADGKFQFLLPPQTDFRISAFSTAANLAGEFTFRTPALDASGVGVKKLGDLVLGNAAVLDTDGDGLLNAGETAVGTSSAIRDTDADGVDDPAELQAGTNPLGQQFVQNSVIGRVSIPSRFKSTSQLDVSSTNMAVTVWTTASGRRFAYVTQRNSGLDLTTFAEVSLRDQFAVLDVTDASRPVLVRTILLPDHFEVQSNRLEVDPVTGTLAIPSETSGLLLYDVRNPALPVLSHSDPVAVRTVRAFRGKFYAVQPDPVRWSVNVPRQIHDFVVVIDPRTGTVEQSVRLVNRLVRDIDVDETGVYLASTVRKYYLRNNVFTPIHTPVIDRRLLDSQGRISGAGAYELWTSAEGSDGTSVSVSNGVVTFGAIKAGTDSAGFATYRPTGTGLERIGMPSSVILNAPFSSFKQDGNGWLLYSGPRDAGLFNLRNPAVTNSLVFGWSREQLLSNWQMAFGTGVVFDVGVFSLSIRTYGFTDSSGGAPNLSGGIPEIDADLSRAGIQLTPGMVVEPHLSVSDAQGVGRIRFLVDGVPVDQRSVGPWEVAWTVPESQAGQSVRLQVEAIDFSGNSAVLDLGQVDIVTDTFAPRVYSASYSDGTPASASGRTYRLMFNEPVVLQPGAVTLHRRIDGSVVPSTFAVAGQAAILEFDELEAGAYDVVVDGAKISDLVGNAGESRVFPFAVESKTVVWNGNPGGRWSDPGNWIGGKLPGPDSDVLITAPASVEIEIDGPVQVHSIRSSAKLRVTGDVRVSGKILIADQLMLDAGSIEDATISELSPSAVLRTTVGGTLSNVHLMVNSEFGHDIATASTIYIVDDLVVDRPMIILGSATISFEGESQTIRGSGTIHRDTTSGQGILGFGELTIDAGITLTGDAVQVTAGSLVNQGTIRGLRSVLLGGGAITNTGIIELNTVLGGPGSSFGAELFHNEGVITVGANVFLLLTGKRWTGSGTITDLPNSTIRFDQSELAWPIAGLDRQGGTVRIEGTLDLVGGSMQLNAASGDIGLHGATIRNGTIAPSLDGRQLAIFGPANFVLEPTTLENIINQATIATNSARVNLLGDWQNAGTFNLNFGDLRLGGEFSISDIGTINNPNSVVAITGTLLAGGQTLAITAAHGEWRVQGGRFENGTISLAAGVQFHLLSDAGTPATLNDADVTGNFQGMMNLRVEGTVRFTGDVQPVAGLLAASPEIFLSNGAVLSEATIAAPGRINLIGPEGGSAELGSGVSITSGRAGIGLHISGGEIVNHGTIRMNSGVFQLRSTLINHGRVELLAGSQLEADGPTTGVRYRQMSDGTLILHLGGVTNGLIGRIRIGTGDEVILGGTLVATVEAGYTPVAGDSIRVIDRIFASNPPAVLSGNFAAVQTLDVPPGLSVVLEILSFSLDIRFQ